MSMTIEEEREQLQRQVSEEMRKHFAGCPPLPDCVIGLLRELGSRDDWLKDIEPDPYVEILGSSYDAEAKRITTHFRFSPACAQRLINEGVARIEGDRLVFVAPEETARFWRDFDQAVLAFGKAHPVFKAAPDPEPGYADPPEDVITPSRARAWLKSRGVDAIVTLTREGFVVEPEWRPLHQMGFRVRQVKE